MLMEFYYNKKRSVFNLYEVSTITKNVSMFNPCWLFILTKHVIMGSPYWVLLQQKFTTVANKDPGKDSGKV